METAPRSEFFWWITADSLVVRRGPSLVGPGWVEVSYAVYPTERRICVQSELRAPTDAELAHYEATRTPGTVRPV